MKQLQIKYYWVIVMTVLSGILNTQCHQPTTVNSTNELKQALSITQPGHEILLADGNFSGDLLISNLNGTADKPIVIRAKNQGNAIIESEIKIQGNFIAVVGCKFEKQGAIIFEGTGCRLSRCTFSDSQVKKWVRVLPGSMKMEISHNLFENKTNNAKIEKGCQLMQVVVRNQNEQHHIHHNLFRDITPGKVSNGYETLQLITENNPFDPPSGDCNTIIENNLFIRCNGEAEIISVKSNGNIIRKNTFRDSQGGLVLRHGDNNVATQNFVLGNGNPGIGGIRIQGSDQVVCNNYFYNLGQYGVAMMDGTPDDLYVQVERAQILFNTFVNCANSLAIGLNHPKHPNGTPPKDCTIAGNIFYNEKDVTVIRLIQNDLPLNWTWQDNIAFGGEVNLKTEGMVYDNPHLQFEENKIAWPTDNTPTASFSSNLLKTDLLGQSRKATTTIGAIQFPAADFKILSAENVGPKANNASE
jgi:poly(beta-D-mannuronate) lyase